MGNRDTGRTLWSPHRRTTGVSRIFPQIEIPTIRWNFSLYGLLVNVCSDVASFCVTTPPWKVQENY